MKFEQLTRFARGFVYAYNGIRAAVQEERNFRFHLCAAFYAFVAAFWAELDPVETALIALCVAAVLALELVNSAIERAVDKPDTTHWWSAGAAKDMAAGAVLVMAVGTLIVALCVILRRRLTAVIMSTFTIRRRSFLLLRKRMCINVLCRRRRKAGYLFFTGEAVI